MRTAPLNYIITLALAGGLWALLALVLGGHLGTTVALALATPEEFLRLYRILLGVAALVGVLLTFAWYYYGARPTTVGEFPRAKRLWTVLLFCSLTLGVGVLVALALVFQDEAFTMAQYALFLGAISALTWLLFWVCTLLMSPRTVQTIPWGR